MIEDKKKLILPAHSLPEQPHLDHPNLIKKPISNSRTSLFPALQNGALQLSAVNSTKLRYYLLLIHSHKYFDEYEITLQITEDADLGFSSFCSRYQAGKNLS